MSEQPLPTTTPDREDHNSDNLLADHYEMYASDASRRINGISSQSSVSPEAAQESRPLPLHPESSNERPSRAKKLIVGFSTGAALLLAGATTAHALAPDSPPTEGTVVETVMPGDTLSGMVAEIPGSEKYNQQDLMDAVKNDPNNKATFEDNRLDPGEKIVFPEQYK
jgi:hypothetical protein